jgi:hypothetical protein
LEDALLRPLRPAALATLSAVSAFAGLASPSAAQLDIPPIHSVELSPRLPTDADEVSVLIRSGTGPGCTHFEFPEQVDVPPLAISPLPVRITGRVDAILVTCPAFDYEHQVGLGRLAPGSYVLQLFADQDPVGTSNPENDVKVHEQHFVVAASSERVTLHNGQFVVEAEWIGGPSAGEPLHAVTLGKDAGYFWSFGSTNVELTVKILDGGLVNGKYWVFLAPMTSLGLEVTVYDARGCTVPACPSEVYVLEPGKPDTLFDLDAFPSSLP